MSELERAVALIDSLGAGNAAPIKTVVEIRDKRGNVLATGPDLGYCVHLLVDRIERDVTIIAQLHAQLTR